MVTLFARFGSVGTRAGSAPCFSWLRIVCLPLLLTLCAVDASAQRPPFNSPSIPLRGTTVADPDGAEFHFARLIYAENRSGRGFRGRGTWTTDWPEAEHFFIEGITRLTNLDTMPVNIYNGDGAQQVSLTDDKVFDYPFLYAVEVGFWSLSSVEAARLREYLLKGGFLMVDDFHGSQQWAGFETVMRQVFPDRPIVDIPDNDEVFRVLYNFDEKIQIPGLASLQYGMTYEQDGVTPNWRGIYDDKGRLVVMINHNMDLGDAWEHADDPRYPQPMTAMAYRFAVNYVIYAMSH